MSGTWVRGTAAVLAALVAATALVGCSSNSGSRSKGGSTTVKSTKGANRTSSARKATGKCADLGVSTDPGSPAADGQQVLLIVFTNRGKDECTLAGYPGVRLDGVDGLGWDIVRRQGTDSPALTLRPQGKAAATLTYAPQPDGWEVRKLLVTPPDTTATRELAWPAGRVLLQDAATHPATHIGQVVAYG
ncbi:DUF4232 domain-containing protein [Saccharothrix longispora]|uniref:DUF4232 domain-containing protein n=1 Tax=Saccharothrix longispora TaxID=33920 RepID=A0ABU1Q345_9PSEU|nr:DUF4232 domain-containing protein [Saccharothrix longispora]MDR6597323.1 hypothetical protein [Saccharothrix longispora]